MVGHCDPLAASPPLLDAGLFELEVIGAEESLTTRRAGRLFCYHDSSRTDVNLREGRVREREREQGRDGAEQRGLKGEERGRSVRVGLRTPPRLLLFSDWPSLLPLSLSLPPSLAGEDHLCHVT